MSEPKDAYAELRENRAHLATLFASRGWEILLEWTKAQTAAKFEEAIRASTQLEREEARVEGLTMEKFVRLAYHIAENAGLNDAEEAPEHPAPATSEAQ